MLCYVARPIDLVDIPSQDKVKDAITTMHALLGQLGVSCYLPHTAFSIPRTAAPEPFVHRINSEAVRQADLLVALYPECRSIGVPMELEMARSLGIPILIVTEVQNKSWSLAGIENAFVRSYLDPDALATVVRMAQMRIAHKKTGQPMWVVVEEGGRMPARTYEGDAGFDLFVSRDTILPPGVPSLVPSGVRVEMPSDCWGLITGRSSTISRKLLVTNGVIDQGWRGELFAAVTNLGGESTLVKTGERICQFIPFPLVSNRLQPIRTGVLSDSDRGTSGFGSSGM